MRFDTHFFVALAPSPLARPQPDGVEVDRAAWYDAAGRARPPARRASIDLVFPTIKTLETLLPFATADEVLAAAPDREIEPILPRVVGTREDHRILLPGDDGYDERPDMDRSPAMTTRLPTTSATSSSASSPRSTRRSTPASSRSPGRSPRITRPIDGTIDVTTGLGYPKKADDARRNPQVALLFSDPTGSGISSGMRVLVQGIAEVDESDLDANADRYLRESGEKLPATKTMQPPGFMRSALRWYYARIYVQVRPERVFVWPDGDMAEPPQIHDPHIEEVRSGHSQEPAEPHAPAAGGETRWDARMDELGSRHSDRGPLLGRPRRLSARGPAPGRGRPLGPAGADRGRARRPPARGRPRLPGRARARARLHLAGELPGARRPGPRTDSAGRSSPTG